MQILDKNSIVPENPDVTVIIDNDTLSTVNIPSNQLHRPITLKKRLNLGYSVVEVYSDSMMIYAVDGFHIYSKRKINIGLFQSNQSDHFTIDIH